MAETLAQLLDEQEETNYRLDEIDDRFLDFFRQMARDRMDLMEMLREMKGGGNGGGDGGGTGAPTQEDTGGGGGLFRLGARGLLGTAAALYLNELGAVFIEKIPGAMKSIGTKISEFTKNIGEKFKTGIDKAKTKVSTAAGTFTERLKAFGNSMSERAGKVGGAIKSGAGIVGDKIKGVGSSVSNFFSNVKNVGAEKLSQVGARLGDLKETAQIRGMMAMDAIKGSGAYQKAASFGKAAMQNDFVKGTAKFGMKALNRVIAPATSAYAGYQMAQERDDLSGAGKLAVGVGGAASAFAGGFADFIKLVTVDAAIEAGQKMGVLAEDGLAQAIQDQSVQRDVFDPMVRSARDMLADGIASGTMQAVSDGNGSRVVFVQNNQNQNQTNNTTTMGSGTAAVASPVVNNGTRSAYEGA